MIELEANNLSLVYPLRQRLSLTRAATAPTATGGSIDVVGHRQFVRALSDVNFRLEPGDRLGLVGSNGAGKTTLLKVLYGIYPPTSGSVRTQGRIDALFNINLGFRAQASGRRNIMLRGLINGWSEQRINERMEEIIEFSELGEFIDAPFKTYSQGMAARLAFAVATSCDPQILLMDEWIGAGDPAFQAKAKQRMEDLTASAGIIVLASHNHSLLQRVCNKVLELEKGRIKAFESAESYFKSNQR